MGVLLGIYVFWTVVLLAIPLVLDFMNVIVIRNTKYFMTLGIISIILAIVILITALVSAL